MAASNRVEGSGKGFDAVSVLMEVERRLRKLATDLQMRRGDPLRDRVREADVGEIKELQVLLQKFDSWFETLRTGTSIPGSRYDVDLVDKVRSALNHTIWALGDAQYVARMCKDLPYYDEYCTEMARTTQVFETIDDLMKHVKQLTGRECGYAARSHELRRRYDLVAYLNDISNCVHVIAEWLPSSGLPVSTRRVGKRCNVSLDADEKLLDICVKWDEKVEDMKPYYEEMDYRALNALVDRDEAAFRVGSSTGHAARVKSDGTFIYYDRDVTVLSPVKYLMELSGYSCEMVGDDQLRCTPPGPDALNDPGIREKIANLLSWMTSADIRIGNRIEDSCKEWCVEMKRIDQDKCIGECIDRIHKEERRKVFSRRRGEEPNPIILEDLYDFTS